MRVLERIDSPLIRREGLFSSLREFAARCLGARKIGWRRRTSSFASDDAEKMTDETVELQE